MTTRIRTSAPAPSVPPLTGSGTASGRGPGKWLVKNAVEIELTTRCNLGCYNCDRSTSQAPSGERMSKAQLRLFMLESLRSARRWDYISLLGGEPALYPWLPWVLAELKRMKFNTDNVQVVTNGYGPAVRAALKRLPAWTLVNNTSKKTRRQRFRFYNLAPADLGVKNAEPCGIPGNCGHGLTRYGYYPCGAGASIDRVFGLGVGIRRLRDLTPENSEKQLKTLCRWCGHSPSVNKELRRLAYWEKKGEIRETAPGVAGSRQFTAPMSRSWLAAYEKYRKKKPELRLYGE